MKVIIYLTGLLAAGMTFVSCSRQHVAPVKRTQRLDLYVNSDNEHIAGMFSEKKDCGVQPALTQKELGMLDALVDGIAPEVRAGFDRKYTAWLNCWTPLEPSPIDNDSATRELLKCNGVEFQELIEFCRQQNDEIFLLLYQLASRASCPYDRLLLHPVNNLLANFPEFNRCWQDVDMALQMEKPDLKDRACNEPTIWCTRKILETRYGHAYAGSLAAMTSQLIN
jgi:hypothetical protein